MGLGFALFALGLGLWIFGSGWWKAASIAVFILWFLWVTRRRKELGEGERGAIREEIRQAIYKEHRGQCAKCEMKRYLHMHHIKPRHLGGDNRVSNLILLCPNHHAAAHNGNFHS